MADAEAMDGGVRGDGCGGCRSHRVFVTSDACQSIHSPKGKTHDYVPSFVVSLADVTGDASTPQQALDTERAGFAQKVGAIQTDTPGTVCGYPGKTITYTFEGRQGTTLMVAAKDRHNKIWIAKVSTQTTEPDNPDFMKAKQVILGGFQFSLPAV